MSTERESAEVFAALCSAHAREMLVAAASEQFSAEEFADHCDVSLPTVYRHVEALVDLGMLEERTELDPDGNHYTVYRTNLDYVRFDLNQSGFLATVRRQLDVVDRFGDLWNDLEAPSD
ncbi:ArsR/SmtB family transcription factor [Halomarina salina]|uniref:ArsR/SmtB family transcription factor n=1 Tax=Halomarina salina TaxID=1872699 RepID=A0ABD5RN57_9EURY